MIRLHMSIANLYTSFTLDIMTTDLIKFEVVKLPDQTNHKTFED